MSAATPLPQLAFDHAELLQRALRHLRRRLGEAPVCFELLPETFTLSELQALTEAILGQPLDRRNFRRKVMETGLVLPAPGLRGARTDRRSCFGLCRSRSGRATGHCRCNSVADCISGNQTAEVDGAWQS